jgi:hypothetical protein
LLRRKTFLPIEENPLERRTLDIAAERDQELDL